jgi:hypothetical protein
MRTLIICSAAALIIAAIIWLRWRTDKVIAPQNGTLSEVHIVSHIGDYVPKTIKLRESEIPAIVIEIKANSNIRNEVETFTFGNSVTTIPAVGTREYAVDVVISEDKTVHTVFSINGVQVPIKSSSRFVNAERFRFEPSVTVFGGVSYTASINYNAGAYVSAFRYKSLSLLGAGASISARGEVSIVAVPVAYHLTSAFVVAPTVGYNISSKVFDFGLGIGINF